MPGGSDPELDQIVLRLRGEFMDAASDRLERMGDLLNRLRDGVETGATVLHQTRQDAHSLKSIGGTYGFPLITVVSHRLEDYLLGLDEMAEGDIQAVVQFVETMQNFLAGGYDETDDCGSLLVRDLPVRVGTDFELVEPIPVEILMVMPASAMGRHIEAELHACGYRVVQVRSSFEAIEVTVRTRPDLVIVSGLLDELNGSDLARTLAVIEKTREISVVLVTSFERDHPELAGLPLCTAIIPKDAQLGDDLAAAITELGVTGSGTEKSAAQSATG